MQVHVQQLSPVLIEFQVEIPAEVVRAEVDKAYTTLQKTARVRGFRPGKAPRDVLTHLYGESLLADVGRRIIDETLPKALSEKNVQPISQPAIETQRLATAQSFLYKARFEVRPEIASVDYDGLEVKKPSTQVSDEMIAAELERLRKEHATLVEPAPARGAKAGDVLNIGLSLDVNGKPMKDVAAENLSVELGNGQLLPDLDAALTGASAGDEREVPITFPETHPRPDFRGKSGTFRVKVKDVKERSLPALDDDFAKDVGSFESLEKLREDVKGRIERDLKQKAEDAVAEQIVVRLCEKNPIPVPPSLVEQQCRAMEQELVQQARRQGQQLGVTEELHARVHADSEMKVRAGLLMAEIAKNAQMKITDEDIENGINELAEQTGKQAAKLRVEYREPKKREILIGMILEDKILDMIEAKAKITDA